MSAYTKVNLKAEVDDMAPRFGMEGLEARFAREPLHAEKCGLSYFKLAPNSIPAFGHSHAEQEEVYVVLSGNAKVRVGDDELELGAFDAIRIAPGEMRAMGGGPNGAEVIAFGAPKVDQRADVEMVPGWWT